jgi:hypothetical protein
MFFCVPFICSRTSTTDTIDAGATSRPSTTVNTQMKRRTGNFHTATEEKDKGKSTDNSGALTNGSNGKSNQLRSLEGVNGSNAVERSAKPLSKAKKSRIDVDTVIDDEEPVIAEATVSTRSKLKSRQVSVDEVLGQAEVQLKPGKSSSKSSSNSKKSGGNITNLNTQEGEGPSTDEAVTSSRSKRKGKQLQSEGMSEPTESQGYVATSEAVPAELKTKKAKKSSSTSETSLDKEPVDGRTDNITAEVVSSSRAARKQGTKKEMKAAEDRLEASDSELMHKVGLAVTASSVTNVDVRSADATRKRRRLKDSEQAQETVEEPTEVLVIVESIISQRGRRHKQAEQSAAPAETPSSSSKTDADEGSGRRRKELDDEKANLSETVAAENVTETRKSRQRRAENVEEAGVDDPAVFPARRRHNIVDRSDARAPENSSHASSEVHETSGKRLKETGKEKIELLVEAPIEENIVSVRKNRKAKNSESAEALTAPSSLLNADVPDDSTKERKYKTAEKVDAPAERSSSSDSHVRGKQHESTVTEVPTDEVVFGSRKSRKHNNSENGEASVQPPSLPNADALDDSTSSRNRKTAEKAGASTDTSSSCGSGGRGEQHMDTVPEAPTEEDVTSTRKGRKSQILENEEAADGNTPPSTVYIPNVPNKLPKQKNAERAEKISPSSGIGAADDTGKRRHNADTNKAHAERSAVVDCEVILIYQVCMPT